MNIRTYRARSVAEALQLVRAELGPDACVLKTQAVGGLWSRWLGSDEIEVTATVGAPVPSRLPQSQDHASRNLPPAELTDYRQQYRESLGRQSAAGISLTNWKSENLKPET